MKARAGSIGGTTVTFIVADEPSRAAVIVARPAAAAMTSADCVPVTLTAAIVESLDVQLTDLLLRRVPSIALTVATTLSRPGEVKVAVIGASSSLPTFVLPGEGIRGGTGPAFSPAHAPSAMATKTPPMIARPFTRRPGFKRLPTLMRWRESHVRLALGPEKPYPISIPTEAYSLDGCLNVGGS